MAPARTPNAAQPALRGWDDAPAFLLSCPGPLRRHHAAVLPLSRLALPQCLLGSEAQLLAFAAAHPALAPRMFFAPLPEMFFNGTSMAALSEACGLPVGRPAPRLVHLRFGGTRSARVLKDARNGLVLAENHRNPPITASGHPFAGGLMLPAAMRRIYTADPAITVPTSLGGGALPVFLLQGDTVAADLLPRGRPDRDGLDIVSLAEFRSGVWAGGQPAGGSAHLQGAARHAARDGVPFVLVPWNLDHPGSAVPALVLRTLRLQQAGSPAVRLVLLPFNYPGQTGLIRRLVRQIRQTIEHGGAALPHLFLARVTRHTAIPALRRLASVAWVDGNDPENEWTMRRLDAAGFSPILLEAGGDYRPGTVLIAADDATTLTAETAFGMLHFHAKLPSLRALRALLPMTQDMTAELAATTRHRRREAVREAAG